VKRLISWLWQDRRGAQIAEFAAVVPMLVATIFGILWFGRAFNIYTTINHAARAAAAAATLHKCAGCGNQQADTGLIESQVVVPILIADHLDPALLKDKDGNDTFAIDPITVTLPSGPQIDIYRARMSYSYNFQLNGITCCPPVLKPLTAGVVINAQAQSKEEH